MSKGPATFTQADMARVIRAAEQVAPGRWRIRVSRSGEIIVEPAGQGAERDPGPVAAPPVEPALASVPKWTL